MAQISQCYCWLKRIDKIKTYLRCLFILIAVIIRSVEQTHIYGKCFCQYFFPSCKNSWCMFLTHVSVTVSVRFSCVCKPSFLAVCVLGSRWEVQQYLCVSCSCWLWLPGGPVTPVCAEARTEKIVWKYKWFRVFFSPCKYGGRETVNTLLLIVYKKAKLYSLFYNNGG